MSEQAEPEDGSLWIHHSGRKYTVLFLTNKGGRAAYPRTVVYQGENGERWSGPLSDWSRRMTLVDGGPMRPTSDHRTTPQPNPSHPKIQPSETK